jgi:hypothetical protein
VIVTGIFDLEKYEERGRSTLSYVEKAEWLLKSTVPLIVFVDGEWQDRIRGMRPVSAETIWQPAGPEPKRVPTPQAISRTIFEWNPKKDTPRYFGVMRRKIEWLRRGAELAGESVTWVDLCLPGDLSRPPHTLVEGDADKIKIAEIAHVPLRVRHDRDSYYSDHFWPVGGGVIRGKPEDLVWLDDRVEEEWSWCLENGYAATDEMMIGFVRFQHPERFETYYANHSTLVENFHGIKRDREFIAYMAMRALDDGANEEACRRFDAITRSLQ